MLNKGGKQIVDFIFDNEMTILNDGSATLFQTPNNNVSAVDLTINTTSVFKNTQVGFRKGRGTANNLACLHTFILEAFESAHSVLAVFIDIKSAYDNVNINRIKEDIVEAQCDSETEENMALYLYPRSKLS
uniref:Uncharacterized protein LOC114341917 n=1 Tax=Diabrotica virgifera virgifera TaxID=50390 RepID=A0A6P7GR45_DIAVI